MIINEYKGNGFFDVNIIYKINDNFLNSYNLDFYIKENEIKKINELKFNFINKSLENYFFDEISTLQKLIDQESFYFDKYYLEDLIVLLNDILSENSLNDTYFNYYLTQTKQSYILNIEELRFDPILVNKIDISGNTITKDKTIRSKINFAPGDYYNQNDLIESIDRLKT